MSIIKVENLTFSYPSGAENIFENVNFHIDTNWKLGFIGRNGRGKTTFLKLLMGEYEYSGNIISSVEFEYFPYPAADKRRMTEDILSEICPEAEQWEIMRELALLDMEPEILWRPFETLSNGERTKALLSVMFLKNGGFPLIDEPTNHLDSAARATVAAYLKRKKGFILVSHDRSFLDGCVDHILAINRADIEIQSGNFSSWMMNFERRQQMEESRNERLKKDINRLKESAARASRWSDRTERGKYGQGPVDRGYVGHKSAKMMKRSKSIEARRSQAAEEREGLLKNAETAEELKITTLRHHSERLAEFSEVSVAYGQNTVCEPVSFTLGEGERIALTGGNGSGKSSMLKALLGQDIKYSGEIKTASGIVISYVPQDTSFLKGSLSELAEENGIDESLFKTILRKMGFEREQFGRNMDSFSEGQKKKTLIAASLCRPAHIYVWDEPLNFIDIFSRMQIEELIKEFQPTMLFVEHDEAFRRNTATKEVELRRIWRSNR